MKKLCNRPQKKIFLVAAIENNAHALVFLTWYEEFLTFYADGIPGMLTIMTGLALALKATAIGPVLSCIFSVFSYNLLVRKIKIMFLKGDIQHGREEFYAVNMKTHPS